MKNTEQKHEECSLSNKAILIKATGAMGGLKIG